jgi:hypothetical protein
VGAIAATDHAAGIAGVLAMDLTVIKGGINRLRTKTGSRADTLYDALNCYVTAAKTVTVRPGTLRQNPLPEGTKGLCAFQGKLHVFAITSDIVVSDPYVLHVITHPDDTSVPGDEIEIQEIHFAEPFLGFLYVAAEFVNGDVFHYWLQLKGTWQADTIYHAGDIVEPTVPTGIVFQATRISAPFPSWAPNVPRTAESTGVPGSIVEPTVYNDFYYTVVETFGDNPASGVIEPIWPEADGARVTEETDLGNSASPTTTEPSGIAVSQAIIDRYGATL